MSDYDKEMREHVWQYFTIHASQRMSMLNLFLILSGLVTAGLAACLQGAQGVLRLLGGVMGLFLAIVAFVFWKLDARAAFLVKHAEEAMIDLESPFPTKTAQLFALEKPKTAVSSARVWTYGRSLRVVFLVTGLTGLGGGVLSVLRYYGGVP
jgi:hypothetical protein